MDDELLMAGIKDIVIKTLISIEPYVVVTQSMAHGVNSADRSAPFHTFLCAFLSLLSLLPPFFSFLLPSSFFLSLSVASLFFLPFFLSGVLSLLALFFNPLVFVLRFGPLALLLLLLL